MSKQLVFIDDSGDPGFNGPTSAYFIQSAVIFTNPEHATNTNQSIHNYRKSLGWQDETEFKFRKTNKK